MGTKISALPTAGTLDGTEEIPLVQTSATKKATLAALMGFAVGLTLIAKPDSYEFVRADANTGIVNPSGNGSNVYFIPSNANVPYPVGTYLVVVNDDATSTVDVTVEGDTLVSSADGSTGTTMTINANGQATFLKVTATKWKYVGANVSAAS